MCFARHRKDCMVERIGVAKIWEKTAKEGSEVVEGWKRREGKQAGRFVEEQQSRVAVVQ
jgi:hypothetical protein